MKSVKRERRYRFPVAYYYCLDGTSYEGLPVCHIMMQASSLCGKFSMERDYASYDTSANKHPESFICDGCCDVFMDHFASSPYHGDEQR